MKKKLYLKVKQGADKAPCVLYGSGTSKTAFTSDGIV